MSRKILVTGGAGYIGSHTVIALSQAGFTPVILDNLSNSSRAVLPRLEEICRQPILFYEGDIRNTLLLKDIFREHTLSAVMHFAGLKAVGESVRLPALYYDNNVLGTLTLADEAVKAGLKCFIFSSSATVYTLPQTMPLKENMTTGGTSNPYGTSKYMAERILCDIQAANPALSVVLLRYFNPIGAHESGLIGERPRGIPNNLLPYIAKVASGELPILSIYGNDYPTPDGTGMRDYLHVMDVAEGHVQALKQHISSANVTTYNLGRGEALSVLQVVKAFEEASGCAIPYEFKPRRDGDAAAYYADVQKIANAIGWVARRSLVDMMTDTWRFQSRNPEGY